MASAWAIHQIEKADWTTSFRPSFHQYILRHENPDLYRYIDMKIRLDGYFEMFGRSYYKYIDIGQHKYWMCGTVLNRTLLDEDAHPEPPDD